MPFSITIRRLIQLDRSSSIGKAQGGADGEVRVVGKLRPNSSHAPNHPGFA